MDIVEEDTEIRALTNVIAIEVRVCHLNLAPVRPAVSVGDGSAGIPLDGNVRVLTRWIKFSGIEGCNTDRSANP